MRLLWLSVAPFALYYFLSLLGRALRRHLFLKQTCVKDIDALGLPRTAQHKIRGTAVICGGSISGLLAARVCLDHFEDVVLVEAESWLGRDDAQRRDAWNQEHNRSRVMQYHSFHAYPALVYQVYRKLFPFFDEECKASDVRINPADFRLSTYGEWQYVPYEEYGGALPSSTFVGRIGLETLLRRLVLGGRHEHVRQVIGTVIGVSRSGSDKRYLDKVIVRTEEGSLTLDAVMVMDCTGPASGGMKWLRREGFGVPESGEYPRGKLSLEEVNVKYNPNVYYSTLRFHVPPEVGKKFPGLTTSWDRCSSIYVCLTEAGVESRALYCQRIEGDIVQLCAGAWGCPDLPQTLDEFKEYTNSLVVRKPIPEWFLQILDILDEVKDTAECSKTQFLTANHIRYEKATNLPANFVAAGDSVMRVNPVFGQGCMKAFIGAICLNTLLQNNVQSIPSNFSERFFEMQADKTIPFWDAAKAFDYGYSTTVPMAGETLSSGSLGRWTSKLDQQYSTAGIYLPLQLT
ncbi:uncharacterized protein BT62DRAFT_922394 [Guyanagaster necrorhizus]|uniref:FAD dependent oxidoreductase n=1 Tax=Guyanagaster necrorhizus TaxID=856835 RepID=A0A9P7VL26_9AGAR|nr:uncharacterized protein BT62DRAFT_922394 [Guyanagaster necrorhizus MCA 3950]KAG7442674.1 hypothetical protein BT62DRAFT_922394 [Guyanagaster necrorhizus MCA 3950]